MSGFAAVAVGIWWSTAVTALACAQGSTAALDDHRPAYDDRYRLAATQVGNWLTGLAADSIWPTDARREGVEANLAEGVAGITLFFHQLHAVTGEPRHAREMRRGADWLLTALPAELSRQTPLPPPTSFYYGAPGIAYVLDRVHQSTGERRYRDGARSVVRWLHARVAASSDSGWTSFNDVLFGDAGTGLFLLYAARELDDRSARDLAAGVGRRLISRARHEHGGMTWLLREGAASMLPNFSHGAAGIGYFLATLHRETGAPEFRSAAEAAAAYLLAIARRDSGALYVPYGTDRPEWQSRYDISWAHGMSGTARLFEQLARVTGRTDWRQYVDAANVAIQRSGTPGEGTWRDTSRTGLDRRFGLAGVADFQIDLHDWSRDTTALERARRLADHILSLATVAGDSLYWIQPRHAFMADAGSPGALTGYLHGAAGQGLLLLRLDAAVRGGRWTLRLPDAPP